jgi:hypothetical protein
MWEIDDLVSAVKDDMQKRGSFEPWNLTISGYDADPRALFEIPEVRAWCRQVHRQHLYLPVLLTEDTLSWYLLCLLDIEVIRKNLNKTTVALQSSEAAAILGGNITLAAAKFFGVKNPKDVKEAPRALLDGVARVTHVLDS